MLIKPVQRLFQQRTLLTKGKAHEVIGLSIFEKRAERNQSHTGFARQPPAECIVALICQAANARGEKICSLTGQNLKTQTGQPLREKIPVALKRSCQTEGEFHFVCERI